MKLADYMTFTANADQLVTSPSQPPRIFQNLGSLCWRHPFTIYVQPFGAQTRERPDFCQIWIEFVRAGDMLVKCRPLKMAAWPLLSALRSSSIFQ